MSSRTPERSVRESNHSIVPGHRVIQTHEVARIGSPHTHSASQPTVELIRDGDVVTAIDVTCSCGETIRIWCSYETKQ